MRADLDSRSSFGDDNNNGNNSSSNKMKKKIYEKGDVKKQIT